MGRALPVCLTNLKNNMKTKERISKNVTPNLTTLAEVEERMGDLARHTNARIALIAEMDARILAIKNEYEFELADVDKISRLATEDLEAWSNANPDQFIKRKSIEFLNGTLGFRTGTPKLVPLARAWTWEKITGAVCLCLPNFIRNRPEVDKEAIIGQRDDPTVAAMLPHCGLKVTQGEKFFVETKLTELASK